MGNSNPTKNLEFQIFISSIVSDVKKIAEFSGTITCQIRAKMGRYRQKTAMAVSNDARRQYSPQVHSKFHEKCKQ